MKLKFLVGVFLLSVTSLVQADSGVGEAQRILKEQGFYYGEVSGVKDADTTAAVRRYQIRSGLQVDGELNAETLKSLHSSSATAPAPRAAAANSTPSARDATTTRRNDTAPQEEAETEDAPQSGNVYGPAPAPTITMRPATTGMFAETPYERAPAEVQRSVISAAQSTLARRGYYRGAIDGAYGPATEFALRAYQSAAGMQVSGVFDMDTLASMQLLPGRHIPRRIAPRSPYGPLPPVRGEWIRE